MLALDRLVFALDVPTLPQAQRWVAELRGEVGVFKVGLELFSAAGPAAVAAVHDGGGSCFLDLKLHDIPATMAASAAVAAKLGVRYLTVHAAAGPTALRAVRDAVSGSNTEILAVTVLTSMGADELQSIGVHGTPSDAVTRLAEVAIDAGLHGLVCSPLECASLRQRLGTAPTLMVPGIRPVGTAAGDQTRIATPSEAIASGASLLVVGRPIRRATDPVAAARAIVAEIAQAL